MKPVLGGLLAVGVGLVAVICCAGPLIVVGIAAGALTGILAFFHTQGYLFASVIIAAFAVVVGFSIFARRQACKPEAIDLSRLP